MVCTNIARHPFVWNDTVNSQGICIRLPRVSDEIIVRSDSPCVLYFTKADFDSDQNGVIVPGAPPAFEFRAQVSVSNVWFRAQYGTANVNFISAGSRGI